MMSKMICILILLSQFCIGGALETLGKDAEPLQNLSNLSPDGAAMVIRKSRAVLYREGRHSTGEESGRWALPLISHTLMPAAPFEPHLDHHDPNVNNYLKQDNQINNYIKHDYHKRDYQKPEYQKTSDSQQMVPVLVQLLKNQIENLETLQQQHKLNENQNFINENNIKPAVDLYSETSENSFHSEIFNFDYSSTRKGYAMYKDKEDMYKDIQFSVKKFENPKDEEYVVRRTNEESNKGSYQQENYQKQDYQKQEYFNQDYKKKDSGTHNYENQSEENPAIERIDIDLKNTFRKSNPDDEIKDKKDDDSDIEDDWDLSEEDKGNLGLLRKLGNKEETIHLKDKLNSNFPKSLRRKGTSKKVKNAVARNFVRVEFGFGSIHCWVGSCFMGIFLKGQLCTRILIKLAQQTRALRCTHKPIFVVHYHTMLTIKFMPWGNCKPKCVVNHMDVFAGFVGEGNERTGLVTTLHNGTWECETLCRTYYFLKKNYPCTFNLTVLKEERVFTCPFVDLSTLGAFKEQTPIVIAFEIIAICLAALGGFQIYRLVQQRIERRDIVKHKIRNACCNSDELKMSGSQTRC